MKINTDGVLLGAMAGEGFEPKTIVDIGTGTGVLALMLAQRFPSAEIDAIEIDAKAGMTATQNFEQSLFAPRLTLYPQSFQEFSKDHPAKKYDLIVGNPPFFIDSLKNPDKGKQLARHADSLFFEQLISFAVQHLSATGSASFILPPDIASLCVSLASKNGLCLNQTVNIRSFSESGVHRQIVTIGLISAKQTDSGFVIYSKQKEYSQQFVNHLKDFFTIF